MDDYKFYRRLSNWNDSIINFFNETDYNRFKEIGFFNISKNKKGLVRDHCYSRFSGFKELVFPEILRHPANCQLILHSENVRKGNRLDLFSLEQLFNKILFFDKDWREQEICLSLIKKYREGERYIKKNYIENYYEK